MSREEYDTFVDALVSAETIELKPFECEDKQFFEGCLPVEVMAKRGRESLAYGPLRPVGLHDPRTGKRPWAVVQLRQDNLAATLYNIVGFQTNLKWGEQARVFRMIPGLANAEFLRYGTMHRNTFISAPQLLESTMQYRQRSNLFFAGQITGVEGYVGNVATGYVAGLNAARWLGGEALVTFPPETMIGALCRYVAHADSATFQPMKASLGILPPLVPPIRAKSERNAAYIDRSTRIFSEFKTVVLRVATDDHTLRT
jgi:methylenetetrahydrofolate--tRNA-(uracil-5-)-methyltransferase